MVHSWNYEANMTTYDPIGNFSTDLTRFLTEGIRNRYVMDEFGVCSVYARKARRMINGKMTSTLDIANISVDGGLRGNGIGIAVIEKMHELNPYQATYVESLLNENLHQRLLRDGWETVTDAYPPCVFKSTSTHGKL